MRKKENEKILSVQDINGKSIKRVMKKIKEFKYSNSKYKYKVRIAPGTYIYTKKF